MKMIKHFAFRAGPDGEIVQGKVLIPYECVSDACAVTQNLKAIVKDIETLERNDKPDLIRIGDQIEQALPFDWELSYVEFKDYTKYYE